MTETSTTPIEVTEKQLFAARMYAQGHTLEAIAEAMNVKPRTVKAHLDALRWKLGVKDRRSVPFALHKLGYEMFGD